MATSLLAFFMLLLQVFSLQSGEEQKEGTQSVEKKKKKKEREGLEKRKETRKKESVEVEEERTFYT